MHRSDITWRRALGAGTIALALLGAACTASGEGGRAVNITQGDEGCTPTRIEATPGEKLKLVVKNESNRDYEVEGIDGTKLEEVVVPEGRTREPGYNVPSEPGTHKIKCYVPGGPNTIIEVVSGEGGAPSVEGNGDGGETPESRPSDATVTVELIDWAVKPDVSSVAAGAIKFIATNDSADQVHELAVLKKNHDGTFENMGEIEDIPVGVTGEVVLDLDAGDYVLACLIVPGEAGSTEDHFKKGMTTDFTVTGEDGAAPSDGDGGASDQTPEPDASGASVSVELDDWVVKPDKRSVAAGAVKFTATNASAEHVHELAVLKKNDDGSFEPMGEIEDIPVGVTDDIALDLEAGDYVLACLIVPGEAGSTEDHFKKGMTTDFTVTD